MNNKKKIFIDGGVGTTGLRIHQRLSERDDVHVVVLSDDKRKDIDERVNALRNSDLAILCLPDDASAEIAAAVQGDGKVKICDASTAHRTKSGWVYGLPELKGKREEIKNASRVAVPGCYASGFNILAAPLVKEGIMNGGVNLNAFSMSGYSGAGKTVIAQYENSGMPVELEAPRQYSLMLNHKHLPEMKHVSGLDKAPVFSPVICDYYCGMLFSLPISYEFLSEEYSSAEKLAGFYKEYYGKEKLIKVFHGTEGSENGFIAANKLAGMDSMELFIAGNSETALLMARYDNLGKGASGACIQCMNIMLGFEETSGLQI